MNVDKQAGIVSFSPEDIERYGISDDEPRVVPLSEAAKVLELFDLVDACYSERIKELQDSGKSALWSRAGHQPLDMESVAMRADRLRLAECIQISDADTDWLGIQ